jgi:hypothetical protein
MMVVPERDRSKPCVSFPSHGKTDKDGKSASTKRSGWEYMQIVEVRNPCFLRVI